MEIIPNISKPYFQALDKTILNYPLLVCVCARVQDAMTFSSASTASQFKSIINISRTRTHRVELSTLKETHYRDGGVCLCERARPWGRNTSSLMSNGCNKDKGTGTEEIITDVPSHTYHAYRQLLMITASLASPTSSVLLSCSFARSSPPLLSPSITERLH